MAKKVKHERPSLERMVTESPDLIKIAENFQVGIYLTPVAPTSCGRAIRGLRSI